MRRTIVFVILAFVILLSSCNGSNTTSATDFNRDSNNSEQFHSDNNTSSSIVSEPLPNQTAIYIAPNGNDETGNGSLEFPWKSILKARDFIRTINAEMTSDIYVYLRGGTYQVDYTIWFTNTDSGKNGYKIHYENYPGEVPEISGGIEIKDWELYDPVKNIYQTYVNPKIQFRQLYVDGNRAVLARTPNLTEEETGGPYFLGGKWNYLNSYQYPYPEKPYYFKVESENIPVWNQSSPLELATVDHWRLKIARIKNFDKKGALTQINLKEPESSMGIFSHANQYLSPLYTPYYFQNDLALLDSEGEWYLDPTTHVLYYKPRTGENLDSVQVIAPVVETILNIEGLSGGAESASNMIFKGLEIEYSTWETPNGCGYSDYQEASVYASGNKNYVIPGAIQLKNADQILFENCIVKHTGANAIVASDFEQKSVVSNCLFQNNEITDTSAGGIYLNLNSAISSGNTIQNNRITFGGRMYANGVGIKVGSMPNAKVLHNEISDYKHCGISFGNSDVKMNMTDAKIEIAYNKIHDVMQLLDDSAGIYSVGDKPDSIVHDNYIYNIEPSQYSGFDPENLGNIICAIYNDGGSSNKNIYSNVIDNTGYAFASANQPNYNNTFESNFYNCQIGNVSSDNRMISNYYINAEWPAEAQKIIKNAGIIPE